MKFTVVIAATFAAALTLCSAAAAQMPGSNPEAVPSTPGTAPAAAAQEASPKAETGRLAGQAAAIPSIPIEESPVPLRGAVVGVPVPGLTQEIYIGLGAAHQVSVGDYFLAFSPSVRAIAVIRAVRVQDRVSAVESLAQLASLRNGDSVKRITERSAESLIRQIGILTAGAPPLSSSILIDPDLLAASRAIEAKGQPGTPVPVPAPVPAGLPDLTNTSLQAESSKGGVRLRWQTPPAGAVAIARYVIYRGTDPASPGTRLAEKAGTDNSYEDSSELEKAVYIYRLAAVDPQGRESALFPSVEVAYSPGKKKMLLGRKPPKVKVKGLPPFVNPRASETPALPFAAAGMPPTAPAAMAPVAPAPAAAPAQQPPAAAPLPSAAAAPAPAPLPAAAPLPAGPETGAALPSAETPAVPQATPAPPPLPEDVASAAPEASPPIPAEDVGQAAPASAVLPAPGRFSARVEGTTVEMSWNPVATKEKLAGYVVYRGSPDDELGAPLNSKPVLKTSYRDRSAEMGQSYYYWVIAQTVEGRLSEPSRKVKVDMPKSKGVIPFF